MIWLVYKLNRVDPAWLNPASTHTVGSGRQSDHGRSGSRIVANIDDSDQVCPQIEDKSNSDSKTQTGKEMEVVTTLL